MNDQRRSRSTLFLTAVAGIAVVAGACSSTGKPAPTAEASAAAAHGSAAASSRPASPESALAGTMLVVGRRGDTDFRIVDAGTNEEMMTVPIGATTPTWSRILSASPGTSSTALRETVLSSGANGPDSTIQGRWQLPTMGSDPVPVGRSANGAVAVLVPAGESGYGSGTTSRFAILGEAGSLGWTVTRTIELEGAFEYDALSADGSILYVVERLENTAAGRYQVRSIDVRTGVMDATPITDKRVSDEPMAGAPITQLRRSDGFVLTLYRGPEHPFVHALSTAEKWALCIDLPETGAADDAAAQDWGLAQTPDGSSVFAINASLGLAVDIDPRDLAVRRTATIRKATAAVGPTIVLAKFGHGDEGTVGRRVVVSPSAETILAGGRDGITAVGTTDLKSRWQSLSGKPVASLALTADGSTLFVLLASGEITAINAADGSVVGTVPGSGFDRLVAVTAG